MLEKTINISFPVKENILLSLKETKEQFTQDLLYLSALMLYRKKNVCRWVRRQNWRAIANLISLTKLIIENETIFDYSEHEMDEIFADAQKLP